MNSSQGEAETLPVLFNHCKDVYAAMLRSSSKQSFIEDGQTKEAVLYEGFLTKLVTEDLHLSVPYYTSVMRALKKMGCVEQVRRGGSTSPSQWRLYFEPTEDLFKNKAGGKKRASSQHDSRLSQVEGIVQTLNQRVTTLENILRNLADEETKV